MVQVVNRRFFGQEIPLSVTRAAKHTLQNLGEAVWPWKYRRAIKSREKILEYCEHAAGKDVHPLDVGHNIGEVVQAMAGALRVLHDNPDKSVEEIFTRLCAPTPQVPRIATAASRCEGLLHRPARPGRTVFIFKIARAAAETQDLEFTFGTGRSERLCVFKDFFLAFTKDLQQKLREG